jgi:hypothetical protein
VGARDGGEAGLHPSNIHDNAYAVGAVDFTGDMPVILGPDGPSLGGFVCPATVIEADLWKLGQLKAGDRCASCRSRCQRGALAARGGASIAQLAGPRARDCRPRRLSPLAGGDRTGEGDTTVVAPLPATTLPAARDGPPELDLVLRFKRPRADAGHRGRGFPGIVDLTPGIRSLQVHYDPRNAAAGRAAARIGARRREPAPSDDISRCPRASCTCRCPGTTRPAGWRSRNTCSRCARTRRGARATSSSSAASTGGRHRGGARDRLRGAATW